MCYDGRPMECLVSRGSSRSARAGSGGDGHDDGLGSKRVAPAALWMLLLVAALASGLVGCANTPSAASTAPTISSLSQNSGAVGTSITITGTNFGATQGTSTVTFNGTAATAVTSWSATSIVVTVPAGTTTGNVVVTVSGVASNGVNYVVPAIITSLSPASGAVGASITITGTNFGAAQGGSTVTFNGTAVTAVTSWSATSIVVTVPAGATTGNVVVTVSGVASNGSPFTVAPGITSLAPNSGAIGALITITGTNFGAAQGGSTVTFNGTAVTAVTSWSATSIVVTVPALAVTGNVVVTVGGIASSGVPFTVTPAPAITILTPNAGAVGASVIIAGTNFGTTQGASTVTFNGTAVTSVTNWSAVSIVVKVPTGATTGNVIVNAAGVASNAVPFTVTPAPAITTLTPNTGAVGASVIIAGTNFGATQVAGSTITFNGIAATSVTIWSATSITAIVPVGATTGNVVVNAAGVASNGMTFTVTPTPVITSLLPNTGAVGASVIIAGTNFGATQGTSTVTFSGIAVTAVANWSATSITVTVPAGATTGNVVVNAAGVASNGVIFTVTPAPAITTLTPNAGAIGASVIIAGTNFGATQVAGSTVTFNGISAGTAGSWTPSSITVTVPAGASTGNVVVNAAGVASTGSPFTVTAAPAITLLSQTSGAVGTSITITGTNFGASQVAGSTVSFGGTTAPVTFWSATSIVVPVPVGAISGNVIVTVAGVPSNGMAFTVAPVLTTLTPNSGPIGASITIAGSNFGTSQGGSTVTFNGTPVTVVTSWSAASLVVTVPAGATTGNVVVTVGAQASNALTFTVTPAPAITTLSQISGAIGTPITITGTNFGATQVAGSTVTFNGTTAPVTTWSNTSILVPVPSGATTGSVVVNVAGVASNGSPFTVTANCTNNCVISGSVSGPWVASVTVTLSGGPSTPAPTTTNASGAYSFTGLTAGTYTVTPSLPGYTYSPATPAVVATAGATQNFTASPVVTTYSISGTITYASGLHTGNTIIRVYQSGNTCMNCSPQAGTSLSAAPSSAGTAYTVRGLPSGTYVVDVEIETQGTGVPNSSNPDGSSSVETITSSNLTAVNVAVSDRTPAAPSAPSAPSVFPSSGAALVVYNEVDDLSGEELATSYKLSYGTDTGASNVGTPSYPAGDTTDVFAVTGLTNGTAYYFKLAAVNGSGTSTYSSVVGPITINNTSGGNTVSGTVTFTGITPTGRLNVGLFSGTNGVYFASYTSPTSGQAFSIAGVPSGLYSLFAFLDQKNCNYICAGDFSNFIGTNGPPQINVTGASSGNAITLTAANANVFVTTGHTTGGGPDSYNVNVGINSGGELPISMTLYSAPGVGVPLDMAAGTQSDYNPVINNSVSPTVGDPYEFQVTFSNASTQTIPASVTEVLSTFARSVSETTSGLVNGVTLSRNVPEFTWAAPSPLPTSTYTYQVQVSTNNGQIWNYKGGKDGNGLPSTTLSAVFNSDLGASQPSLATGTAYTVSITVTDNSGNSATIQTSYTP
jgi:IPT/TIG domain/Carboxypeptidase regulatory-like domain